MKKFIMIFIVFIMFCFIVSRFKISNIMYASSIYVSHSDKYDVIILCPSATSVGSKDNKDNSSSLIKVSGDSFDDVFNKASESSVLAINYRHIVSVVFDVSALNKEVLDEFNAFMINNASIDFNFYIFTSTESGEDLFSFKNPDKISSYFSTLNVNELSKYLYTYASYVHYVEFLRQYQNNEAINIPYVEINEDYMIDDKKSKNLSINGLVNLKDNNSHIILKKDNPYLFLLNEFTDGTIYINEFDAIIKKNSISYDYKDKLVVKLKIYYKGLLNLDNTEEFKDFLLEKVNHSIKYFEKNDIDYFNLNAKNQKHKKNYSYDSLDFKLSLNKI